MKRKSSVIIALTILVLTSCAYNASLVNTSYKALSVSQTSYDTAMKMAADLDSRGLLGPKDKTAIIQSAATYSAAHNSAVNALANYSDTKSSSDSELLEKQMTIASEALSNILTIIKPYLGSK